MIGEHERAEECTKPVLAGYGSGLARSVQINTVHRARAVLGRGDLDAAIDIARPAVPMAQALRSQRSVAVLNDFDAALAPYAQEPSVREWRGYLHAERIAG